MCRELAVITMGVVPIAKLAATAGNSSVLGVGLDAFDLD